MKKEQLQYGDVLLYEGSKSLIQKLIRLVTGSKFTHVAVVIEFANLLVFEQLIKRKSTLVLYYQDELKIIVMRPKFNVKPIDFKLINNSKYGWVLTIDHLLNHGIGRILHGWKHRHILSRVFQRDRMDCGHLVSSVLGYWPNEIPEPDDYSNDKFENLGELEQ